MSRLNSRTLILMMLRLAPLMLFAILCVAFGLLSDRFLSLANFRNILTQSTHVAVMAIGMTFVLLVRGVDLSVGSVMYLVAVVMGLYLSDVSLFISIPLIMVIGAAFGAINACFITGLRDRAVHRHARHFVHRPRIRSLSVRDQDGFPERHRAGAWADFVLRRSLGDLDRRRRRGGRVDHADANALRSPDLRCRSRPGLRGEGRNSRPGDYRSRSFAFAASAPPSVALISVSQVGAASATFGYQEEFPVIAAAVLGGTSLFGGRGGVFGSIFGAVLVQTTSNGLVMLNANPYLYPLVNSVIIFIAAWVDGRRRLMTERLEQRKSVSKRKTCRTGKLIEMSEYPFTAEGSRGARRPGTRRRSATASRSSVAGAPRDRLHRRADGRASIGNCRRSSASRDRAHPRQGAAARSDPAARGLV